MYEPNIHNMTKSTTNHARRSFLGRLIALWTGITSLPILYGIVEFVYPPAKDQKPLESMAVSKLGELALNSGKIVKFNKEPFILVRTVQDQYKAFSARCTHLGCVVEYRREGAGSFHCNCHGSVFDLSGKNVQGPAPQPLQPARVSIKDSEIIISV